MNPFLIAGFVVAAFAFLFCLMFAFLTKDGEKGAFSLLSAFILGVTLMFITIAGYADWKTSHPIQKQMEGNK